MQSEGTAEHEPDGKPRNQPTGGDTEDILWETQTEIKTQKKLHKVHDVPMDSLRPCLSGAFMIAWFDQVNDPTPDSTPDPDSQLFYLFTINFVLTSFFQFPKTGFEKPTYEIPIVK